MVGPKIKIGKFLLIGGLFLFIAEGIFCGQSGSAETNMIIRNGQKYAEILFLGQRNEYPNVYRGIAIHYFRSDTYEWISPNGGWQLSVDSKIIDRIPDVIQIWGNTNNPQRGNPLKNYKKPNSDRFAKIEFRSDAKLSEDGKILAYVDGSAWGPRKKRYKVK